jgi:hypothetical protein
MRCPEEAECACAAQVPDEVLHDAALNAAIAVLPANYNFEVRGLVLWVVSPATAPCLRK